MNIYRLIFGRRTHKQLLSLLLSAGETSASNGLCMLALRLYRVETIDNKEIRYLLRYIETHRPKPGSKHYDPTMKDNAYYWPELQWEPRKEWLKDQIKKYVI
jgi:hypothetical protein